MLDTLKRMTVLKWYFNAYAIAIWAGMIYPAIRFIYYAVVLNSYIIFITGGLFVLGIYWLTARFLEAAYDLEMERREKAAYNRHNYSKSYRGN